MYRSTDDLEVDLLLRTVNAAEQIRADRRQAEWRNLERLVYGSVSRAIMRALKAMRG